MKSERLTPLNFYEFDCIFFLYESLPMLHVYSLQNIQSLLMHKNFQAELKTIALKTLLPNVLNVFAKKLNECNELDEVFSLFSYIHKENNPRNILRYNNSWGTGESSYSDTVNYIEAIKLIAKKVMSLQATMKHQPLIEKLCLELESLTSFDPACKGLSLHLNRKTFIEDYNFCIDYF